MINIQQNNNKLKREIDITVGFGNKSKFFQNEKYVINNKTND